MYLFAELLHTPNASVAPCTIPISLRQQITSACCQNLGLHNADNSSTPSDHDTPGFVYLARKETWLLHHDAILPKQAPVTNSTQLIRAQQCHVLSIGPTVLYRIFWRLSYNSSIQQRTYLYSSSSTQRQDEKKGQVQQNQRRAGRACIRVPLQLLPHLPLPLGKYVTATFCIYYSCISHKPNDNALCTNPNHPDIGTDRGAEDCGGIGVTHPTAPISIYIP